MDLLFIHGNYPAQFRYLLPLLSQGGKNRVAFLTARQDAKSEAFPGVEIYQLKRHRNSHPETHHYLSAAEEGVLQGQAVIRELMQLIETGFKPRIVIYHAGMGLGLFVKDLLPEALNIGYFEWYFRPETTQYLLANFDFDAQLKTGMRNLPILHELENCDIGIVPTSWQKSQFPKAYHHKMSVVFDGIDTTFFHPCPDPRSLLQQDLTISNRETNESFSFDTESKIISYATRGMEPLRGFPEFMRALPALLAKDPCLQVVIAGADRRAYSYDAPTHKGSWKQHLLAELGDFIGRKRIQFTGLLNYHDYRLLLWRSNLHCYFTRPYVTSWSLFEAAACGARLAINRSPATEGIVEASSATWLDLDEPEGLSAVLQAALDEPSPKQAKINSGFELSKSLAQWEQVLNAGLQMKD